MFASNGYRLAFCVAGWQRVQKLRNMRTIGVIEGGAELGKSLIQTIRLLIIFAFACCLNVSMAHAAGIPMQTTVQAADDAGTSAPEHDQIGNNVHETVAGLSNEQVRRLLIQELQKTNSGTENSSSGLFSKGFFRQ
jgi:hypothetical protein